MKTRGPIMHLRKAERLVLLIGFLTALYLPSIAGLLRYDPAPGIDEKRRFKPFPQTSLTALTSFPEQFDEYYQDHFGLRTTMIRLNSLIRLRALRASSTPRTVIGREGWLFLRGDVEQHRRPNLIPRQHLIRWEKGLESIHERLAARGISHFLVLVPSSASVYPEFLPSSDRKVHGPPILDQFLDHMSRNSTVPILDLRAALTEAKALGRIYHRTDTHWNDVGAYVAYREIVRMARTRIKMAPPIEISSFRHVVRWRSGGDLAQTLGLTDRVLEEVIELVPSQPRRAVLESVRATRYGKRYSMFMRHPDDDLPNALFVHDSFMYEGLFYFLGESFGQISFAQPIEGRVNPTAIELPTHEPVQLVVQEIVERVLMADYLSRPEEVVDETEITEANEF